MSVKQNKELILRVYDFSNKGDTKGIINNATESIQRPLILILEDAHGR
jgi:hypothetical protein